ncbi:cytochrome-c peroxidase [Oceanicola sp. 502str15]|uniref:cytochrome-c peroxidase n=1 Tax=Oceanicola sp. 502str15 TaxID=2696061 RepID=UPI002096246D|nr:cytochrome c peroxidase [Oceanicola sp. 502str15]MCO6382611.1 cytochrome-c peroxidase [Oceanicola sp. 502str15]
MRSLALALLFPLAATAQEFPAPLSDADFIEIDAAEAALGQLLFYDPILSGNQNIACATCHHPRFATSDGLSLGMGEGGHGLGPERVADAANYPSEFIPRNAPALFNLGARQFTVLFHDGRIEVDESRASGFRTPMGEDMEVGFSGILSAQTMFPVLSADEMAGHVKENDVAKATRSGRITGPGGAWDIIARRVEGAGDYQARFEAVYPEVAAGRPLHFTDISNAIAAFMAFEWRADGSAFDAFLRGDEDALSAQALEGAELFYGTAGCSGCHSGALQTDHGFHAMGVPQIGPGKRLAFETHHRDVGRMGVTGHVEDAYAFRTPSLRNVVATAPYGHSGAYAELRDFVEAHAAPRAALAAYDGSPARLAALEHDALGPLQDAADRAALEAAIEVEDRPLLKDETDAIMAFLEALTDQPAIDGRLGVPERVPSGLPVDQ